MKRTKEISKPKLFIEELERPQLAAGQATTLAIGEESGCNTLPVKVTTQAVGEECFKVKVKGWTTF
jgi:hypothetical protein